MRQRVPECRFPLFLLFGGLVAGLLPGLGVAESQDYILEFPARQMIAYMIEFEVPNPGRLAMEMNWTGNRVVSFKLQGPDGGSPTLRRSGPPPLRLHHDVDAMLASRPGQWKLSIRGLPSHEAASGMLTLYFPDARSEPGLTPSPPTKAPAPPEEPWLRPVRPTGKLTPERKRLFETTEQFRVSVTDRQTRDRYDWQNSMLRYLAEHRDRRAELPDRNTQLMLQRSADAVRRVRRLAESTDPFVIDPPDDPSLRRAWLVLRERRIQPLELELDSMLHSIHKGHVPGLADEAWFGRFVSCLIAVEQHFEERGRKGPKRASKGDVVEEQWQSLLLAADALDSLAVVVSSERPEE